MTLRRLIETVKQHHPTIGDTQIIAWLNDAQKEVSDRIGRQVEADGTFNTDGTNVYYAFSDISGVVNSTSILEIDRVDFDGDPIQFIRQPEHEKGY